MLQFGATVRQRRKELGLTQEALAMRAKMDRAHFATVERGVRNIALTGIVRVAAALGLTTADLYRLVERALSRQNTARDNLAAREGFGSRCGVAEYPWRVVRAMKPGGRTICRA